MITVDGDHTVGGAAADLATVMPRLKVGGVLLFDDLLNPPALQRVWDRLVKHDGRYLTWEFAEAGTGIAAAIRVSDQPRSPDEGWSFKLYE
jgi:hypothetical protein